MSQRATCAPTSGAANGRSGIGACGIAILGPDAIVILALPSPFLKAPQRVERRLSSCPREALKEKHANVVARTSTAPQPLSAAMADVLVPVALDQTYSYRVPPGLKVA